MTGTPPAKKKTSREPWERSGQMYVFLLLWGPVLLLAASIGLTVLGLWQESDGVATIGALGVVASLILPRIKGTFKFGPGGFEGGSWDEFFEDVVRRAKDRGLPDDRARELAEVVTQELAEQSALPPPPWGSYPDAAERVARQSFERAVWGKFIEYRVEDAVMFQADIAICLNEVADERGWGPVWEGEVRFDDEATARQVDFVLETPDGDVLIEASDIKRAGIGLHMLRHKLGETKSRVNARAAIVVIPDDADPGLITKSEFEGVLLVRLGELREALLTL
jgi:hypothetical protein